MGDCICCETGSASFYEEIVMMSFMGVFPFLRFGVWGLRTPIQHGSIVFSFIYYDARERAFLFNVFYGSSKLHSSVQCPVAVRLSTMPHKWKY